MGGAKHLLRSLHVLPGTFTQKERPNHRLDLLGASARAMALQAPLGGWCPPFRGARLIEITSSEQESASHHLDTSPATRTDAWASCRPRRYAKTASQPSVARRRRWRGGGPFLTTAPLGGGRRASGEICEARILVVAPNESVARLRRLWLTPFWLGMSRVHSAGRPLRH